MGPGFWHGVADALVAQHVPVECARLPAPEHVFPPYWLTHAATVAAALPEDGDVMLVAHSGAGVLLPAVARLAANRRRNARVRGTVFVDCDLPRDGASRLDLMSGEDADGFRRRAVDGWLPRWSDRQLMPFVADAKQRRALLDDLPRVPLAMYEEAIAVPDEWPFAPCAYLELSPHYAASVAHATAAGWPVLRLPGHHFLPYTDPGPVAAALLTLTERCAA